MGRASVKKAESTRQAARHFQLQFFQDVMKSEALLSARSWFQSAPPGSRASQEKETVWQMKRIWQSRNQEFGKKFHTAEFSIYQ
jgi:hypothetical protein